MLEYCLIVSNGAITSDVQHTLLTQYGERTILDERDENICFSFFNDHSLLLGKSRYNYQGPYFYEENNNFTCLVGYIISSSFQNDKTNIVSQLHHLLINNQDRNWLKNCLGEFQIIHYNDKKLEILCSDLMTHPVYYRKSSDAVYISNRASLTNLSLDPSFKPALDPITQVEIMAFDSILSDRSAFVDTKCLSRGYDININYIGNQFNMALIKDDYLWIDTNYEFYNIREVYDLLLSVSDWFLDHLQLLPEQMEIDSDMAFNLSGGKDSRLLLTLFQNAGLMNYHSHVLTLGEETDAEVEAARQITTHYALEHKVIPRGVTTNVFFERLPLHIYQLEGEINCRVLHGNYLSRRKILFTGHELGIREAFADTEKIHNENDLNNYLATRMPFDPIGFLNKNSISSMYDTLNDIVQDAINWNVHPSDFLTWFNVLGRGSRWLGKLTSMSSPSGLYSNLLCAQPIVKAGINMGVANRKRELLHFALMSSIDKEIIKYPFYNQEWDNDIVEEFKYEFKFPEKHITSNTIRKADTMWWDDIYLDNHKATIKRIICGARHPDLDLYIDYNKLFNYIDKVDMPSARAMLQIYSVISANLLFHAGDITKEGMKRVSEVIDSIKKDIEAHENDDSFDINLNYPNTPIHQHFMDFVESNIKSTKYVHGDSINFENGPCKGLFVHSGKEITFSLPDNQTYSLELFCFAPDKADNQLFEIWCNDRLTLSYLNDKKSRSTCNKTLHRVILSGKVTFKVTPKVDTSYGWCIFGIKNESLRTKPDHIKGVHVGCGPQNIFDGWWNVDILNFGEIDQVLDITQPWPWDNLDYVYGEHFLEHLTVPDAIKFLINAGKALQIGGKIRLSTPSLEWVLSSHFSFEAQDISKRIKETWAINRAFNGWGHQFLYSKEMIEHLLISIGFENIEFFEYGISNDPNLMGLERHGGWGYHTGFPSVWIVEAQKGSNDISFNETFFEEVTSYYQKYVETNH